MQSQKLQQSWDHTRAFILSIQHISVLSAHFPLDLTPTNSTLQNQRKLKTIIIYYNWSLLSNWISLPAFEKQTQHFKKLLEHVFYYVEESERDWNVATKGLQCFKKNILSRALQVQQHKFIFTENCENLDSSPYLAARRKVTVALHW